MVKKSLGFVKIWINEIHPKIIHKTKFFEKLSMRIKYSENCCVGYERASTDLPSLGEEKNYLICEKLNI